MAKITFHILGSDIYPEVNRLTEYIAAKRTGEDKQMFDKLRTTEYNDEILNNFFQEASNVVDLRFKEFTNVVPQKTEEADYNREFDAPARYDEQLWTLAHESMDKFFVHYITSRWLATCNSDAAQYFTDTAAADLSDVVAKLYLKEAPKRVPPIEPMPIGKVKGQLTESSHHVQTAEHNTQHIKGHTTI